ncbi:MAG: tyrosine-type recombinase/integrase [bacterium]|nr:tyrosine-type recombinase/integrase [bacterium]
METNPTTTGNLTPEFIEQVDRPGRYGDGRGGNGLSLMVKPAARGGVRKTWQQRTRIDGKPSNIGLGSYPAVSLDEARARARANAQPTAAATTAQTAPHSPPAASPTFGHCAERCWELKRGDYKHDYQHAEWIATLKREAGAVWSSPVADLRTRHFAEFLLPLTEAKPTVAKKVRQRCGEVMKWAMAMDHTAGDPTSALGVLLPKPKQSAHHEACSHAQVSQVLGAVAQSSATATVKAAMGFLVLTAARSAEVRGMTWAEIDLAERVWTIPAERMKAKREHRIPLSGQAVELLAEAKQRTGGSGLVFPGRVVGRTIGNSTLSELLVSLGQPTTPHGFRSSFRGWCGETGADHHAAEMSLAHAVGSKVEQAYLRTDLLDRRRVLMQQWADYICPQAHQNAA